MLLYEYGFSHILQDLMVQLSFSVIYLFYKHLVANESEYSSQYAIALLRHCFEQAKKTFEKSYISTYLSI